MLKVCPWAAAERELSNLSEGSYLADYNKNFEYVYIIGVSIGNI